MKNKKGSEMLIEQVVFLVIVIMFAVVMMVFVIGYGKQDTIKEEIYAKQIALIIDGLRYDTEVVVNVSSIYEDARKNKKYNDLVTIDNREKKVLVSLNSDGGYSYRFFSDSVLWNLDDKIRGKEKLIVSMKK